MFAASCLSGFFFNGFGEVYAVLLTQPALINQAILIQEIDRFGNCKMIKKKIK